MISVLLLARDEAKNLPSCLEALSWCDDIVVVDDHSTDRTAEIAVDHGARVFTRSLDTFAAQRNWALDTVEWTFEWVLHLDADEVVTPELVEEMHEKAKMRDGAVAYRIPSKMMFMGRWLKHAAAYPVYQVRLGRNPGLRFKQVGHGQQEDVPYDRIGTISEPYLHYPFSKGLNDWFRKHAVYAAREADEFLRHQSHESSNLSGLFSSDSVLRRRAMKRLSARLPARPVARFLYGYVLKCGFLDGNAGLQYCRLMAVYEGMIAAHIADKRDSRETGAFDSLC